MPEEALDVLQMVPYHQRSPKINFALGISYRNSGLTQKAIEAFKQVLSVKYLNWLTLAGKIII